MPNFIKKLKEILSRIREEKYKFIKNGSLAFVGFILSPLSWWNDLFINIPLAYIFAWTIGKFVHIFADISRPLFTFLFILGYFLTNIIGFLMIHRSVISITRNENKSSIKNQIIVSILYTLTIVALSYLDVFKINPYFSIVPDWVK